MNSLSSICDGSLTCVKNFHMNAIPGAFGMHRNSILYPIFEDVMRKLIPSGIPQYLPDFHSFLLHGKFVNLDENEPKVLSYDDLSFGFVLWLFACGVSIIGFFIEFLVGKFWNFFSEFVVLASVLQMVKCTSSKSH